MRYQQHSRRGARDVPLAPETTASQICHAVPVDAGRVGSWPVRRLGGVGRRVGWGWLGEVQRAKRIGS